MRALGWSHSVGRSRLVAVGWSQSVGRSRSYPHRRQQSFHRDLGTTFSNHCPKVSDWVFAGSLAAFGGLSILVLGMIYSYAIDLVSDDDLLS